MENISNSSNLPPDNISKYQERRVEPQPDVNRELQKLGEKLLEAKNAPKLLAKVEARIAVSSKTEEIKMIFKHALLKGDVQKAQAINQSLLEQFQDASTQALFKKTAPFTQAEFESNQKEINKVSKHQQIMKKNHIFRIKLPARIRTPEDLQIYPEIPNPPPSNILLIDDSNMNAIKILYWDIQEEEFEPITTNLENLESAIQSREEEVHAIKKKLEQDCVDTFGGVLFTGSGTPIADDFKNDKDVLFRIDLAVIPPDIEIFVKHPTSETIESTRIPADETMEAENYVADFLETFPLSPEEVYKIPNVHKFSYHEDFDDEDFIDFCEKKDLPADTVLVDDSDPNNYIVLAYDIDEGEPCEYFDVSPFKVKSMIEEARTAYQEALSAFTDDCRGLGIKHFRGYGAPTANNFKEIDSLFFTFNTSGLPIKANIFYKDFDSQEVKNIEVEVTTLDNMKDPVRFIRAQILKDQTTVWKAKGLFTENPSPSLSNFFPTEGRLVKICPSKEHGKYVIASCNPQSYEITFEKIDISSPDFKISDLEKKLERANKEMDELLEKEQLCENIMDRGIPVIDHPPSQKELDDHDFLLITQPPYFQYQVVFLDLIDGSTITRNTSWSRVELTILDVQKHLEYEKKNRKKPPSLQDNLLKLKQSHSRLKGINPEEMAKVADECASCAQSTLTPSTRQSRKISGMKATVVSGDNKDYVILPKELKGKKFAHGAYKAASVATGIHDRNVYAWATTELETESLKRSTVREINVEKELQKITTPESKYLLKPRLVVEYKSSQQTDKVGIVTEFCDIGEFDQISQFPVKKRLELFREALQGVKALHDNNIIHCDLKPANIFLKTNEKGEPEARVADFGLSLLPSEVGASSRGSPKYMPLEIYSPGMKNTQSSDIYAMGSIAHKALLGKTPTVQNVNNTLILLNGLADRDKNNESVADITKEDLAKSPFLQLVHDMMYPTDKNRVQSIDEAISRLDQVLAKPDEIAFLEQYINPSKPVTS